MNTRTLLACAVAAAFLTVVSTAGAQSFSLDDNPSAPLPGPVGGLGAEDPFGISGGPSLAPSPSVGLGPLGGGSIFSPGPAVQHPGPDGLYLDSLSTNHTDNGLDLRIQFSVDRLSSGAAGTAVAGQSAAMEQPADIFQSTRMFTAPGTFVGTLATPFSTLPTALGAGSNSLFLDEGLFGLVAPSTTIGPGTHDNIDAFDGGVFDGNGDALFDVDGYFTVYPDQAAISGVSAADIFAVPAGFPGVPPIPYASAGSLGLDTLGFNTDSIDALIMYDRDLLPGAAGLIQPGVDFALFSLAPGSATLAALGFDAADVFFTDFTGTSALYADALALGLLDSSGGNSDNVDALEVNQVPEPSSLLTWTLLGALGVAAGVRNRRRAKASG